jgi:hypothetical protein
MQRFRGLSTALLFLVLGLGSKLSFAGQPRFLTVIVITGDGHPVTNLLENDFTVFDQGLIRPITSFRAFRGEGDSKPAMSYADLADNARNYSWARFSRYELSFDCAATMPHENPAIKINRPDLKIFVSRER